MTDVQTLLRSVRRGGEQGREASLALGLLIERERVQRPPHDDGGIREILGEEYADRRLSEAELAVAVEGLLHHVEQAGEDSASTVIWALSKSYDERVVPPVINLLAKLHARRDKEHLAYQALTIVMNTGVGSPHNDAALQAVRNAAARGAGDVAQTARTYLDIYAKATGAP